MHIVSNFFILLIFLNIQQPLFGMNNDANIATAFNILITETINNVNNARLDMVDRGIMGMLCRLSNGKISVPDISFFPKQYENTTIDTIQPEQIEDVIKYCFTLNKDKIFKKYPNVDFLPCLQFFEGKINKKNEKLTEAIQAYSCRKKQSNEPTCVMQIVLITVFFNTSILLLLYYTCLA